MSLNQISSIQILDAKTCIIKPYDKEIIKEIISAISNSNLGVNPIADVEFVKINFPSITEETRIKNVKKCKEILEQAKIKLRKVREEVRDIVKKEKTLSEDNIRFFNEEIDKITKLYITKLDDIFVKKEQELMKV
jgi:ribosome recycling factor